MLEDLKLYFLSSLFTFQTKSVRHQNITDHIIESQIEPPLTWSTAQQKNDGDGNEKQNEEKSRPQGACGDAPVGWQVGHQKGGFSSFRSCFDLLWWHLLLGYGPAFFHSIDLLKFFFNHSINYVEMNRIMKGTLFIICSSFDVSEAPVRCSDNIQSAIKSLSWNQIVHSSYMYTVTQ